MAALRAEHNLEDKHGLWLVHEPRAPLRAVCDIVAVHGLGGGPASTWKHKQTHYLWLRDCLPNILEDIPRGTSVRIWTFGYNANVVFSPAVAGIAEFTQSLLGFVDEAGIGQNGRRVIWIAHSLGGVVVKSALIDAARRGSQHSWLLDATIGIIFLATPHQGSHIANKGVFVARVAKYAGVTRVNRETLNSLKQNSGELFDKADQFRSVCGHIKICSFFETLTLGSFGLIVEKRSASIGLSTEELCPLDADHKTICKFENSADMNLKLVQNKLTKMIDMAFVSQGGNAFTSLPIRQPPNDRNGGPGRVGLYQSSGPYPTPQQNNRQPMPGPWRSYQPASVSPYPPDDDDLSSKHGGYDTPPNMGYSHMPPPSSPYLGSDSSTYEGYSSRPSTSASYQSVKRQDLGGQFQMPPRPGQPSFTTQRDPSPPTQRGRAVSNETQMRFPQTTQPPTNHRYLNSGNQPQQQNQEANTSAARTPYLRPRPSGYSLSGSQLDKTNQATSPAPARKPVSPPSPPTTLPPEDIAYMCDACLRNFGKKTARFRCTQCDDYDLCPTCYQKDSTSKGHDTSHKMRSISKREDYNFNDITPAIVIPQQSPLRTLPNWSVDEEERRWLHLRTNPSHERYIVHGIAKGAYLVEIVMHFKFSSHVSLATLNQLKKETIGEMTVVAGAPIDTSTFFKDAKDGTAKENLTSELFASGRKFTSKLEIPAGITDPSHVWEKKWDFSATPILLGAGNQASKSSATLAVLLQWSDVRKFQTNDNPVLLCTIDCIRMDELLEYDEPAPTPAPAPKATVPKPPVQTRAPPPSTADDDDDDDHVTLEELMEAAQILISNNKAVTTENLLTIVMATREVQTELQKALLLRHIQQVQQQQRAERERRERMAQAQAQQAQAAGELLMLSWLLTQ